MLQTPLLENNVIPLPQPVTPKAATPLMPGKKLPALEPNWLLMFDVDGTLLDIAHRPDAVCIPSSLKETLLHLYDGLSGAIALVSGRPVDELDTLFAPLALPVVGLHGGEMRLPGGPFRRHLPSARNPIENIADRCRSLRLEGLLVETKSLSVALHFRLNPSIADQVLKEAEAIVKELGKGWMLLKGKFMCEIKPDSFDKGKAVRTLCTSKPFIGRIPVYIGDDVTDRDAFAVVQAQGGHAIKVGEPEEGLFSIESPAHVRRWLSSLAHRANGVAAQPLNMPSRAKYMMNGKRRLVVVSNRVSLPQTAKANMGGLAVAMSALLRKHGGVWMGWSGKLSKTEESKTLTQTGVSYVLYDIEREEYNRFYLKFCNGILWPILHYNTGLSDFDYEAYRTYQTVNRRYAERLKATLQEGDCIWVHDFHFIPLAKYLRDMGVKNRIGFFLHTPFPSREVLVTLPIHRELMQSLMAYDVVGFQTRHDLQAFQDYAASENISPHAEDREEENETIVSHFPIGIQTSDFSEISREALDSQEARDLKASLEGKKLIIGVDRMDYSKGILHRMKAVDALLTKKPELCKQFSYLQITPPTREELKQYAELRAEVEALVGHTNGKHAMIDWVPIRFLARGIRREIIAAFYRMARVCLVTPLRDGMNLVAKEFISAQDPEDPGVLVLSQFAGAAEECKEALLVNPYDINELGDAIERALTMPLAERRDRWRAMYDTISKQTLEKWYQDYMDALMRST